MILKEIHLIHFGKFHDYTLELGPKLNVIYGPNEAGKSTIYAFIQCMLFGAKRQRGRAAASDIYTRYQPWEQKTAYEGSLTFDHEGRVYRLYRNFYKGEQSVSLVCLDNGKNIPLPHGMISDFIPCLTEENLKNTICTAQNHTAMDTPFALSLQSQAANLAATGSQNLHLDRALLYLKQEKRSLSRHSADGAMAALKAQMESCKRALSDFENGQAGRPELGPKAQEEKKQSLQKQLQDCETVRDQCREQEAMLLAREEQLKLCTPHPSRREYFGKIGFGMTAAGCLLGVLALIFHSRLSAAALYVLLGICGVCLVLGAAGYIFWWLSQKNSGDQNEVSRDQALARLKYEREQLRSKQEAWGKKQAALKQAYEDCIKYGERQLWEQEQRLELKNRLEDQKEQLLKLQKQQQKYQKEIAAIDLAGRIISDLGAMIHEDVGGQLNQYVESAMEEITGHRRHFSLNADLKISVDNSKDYVSMDRLSHGTVDQLYLALRMAAARLLFADMDVPKLFDDAFAFYDDERLEAALSWLATEESGQRILLTCHQREATMLEAMDFDYNYVNLKETI